MHTGLGVGSLGSICTRGEGGNLGSFFILRTIKPWIMQIEEGKEPGSMDSERKGTWENAWLGRGSLEVCILRWVAGMYAYFEGVGRYFSLASTYSG